MARKLLRRVVRHRGDDQLDRIFGSAPVLRVLFSGMARSFQAQKARGFDGELQYELTSRRGLQAWVLRVADGHAVARAGHSAQPRVTMRMSVPLFIRLAVEEDDVGRALMHGELEIEGDLALATRLDEMFGGPSPW